MPVLPPSLTGNEKKFIETFNSPKISICSKDEIENVLKLAFVRIGLRGQNLPNDLEKQVLLSEVLECYGNLTIGQLNQSFELLSRQELDIESTTYENFSIEYLHKVLKSYLRWSSKVYNDQIFNKKTVEPKSELPQPKMSNEEVLQLSKDIYASTKNLMFIESRCYEILELAKTITDNERVNIKKRAIAILEQINEGDKGYKPTDREVIKTCKKIAVAKYFDGQ